MGNEKFANVEKRQEKLLKSKNGKIRTRNELNNHHTDTQEIRKEDGDD